jgi:hypothetical protein
MIADAIKELVIEEFDKFLDNAEIGRIEDYTNIKRKIYFLESIRDLDNVNTIFEYLQNEQT